MMRKMINKILSLLIIILLVSTTAYAQNRGALRNTWSSWANVSTSATSFNFPYDSRDLMIANGSSSAVCASLKRYPLTDNTCSPGTGQNGIIQIPATSELYLYDYVASGVTVRAITGTASPVTVIVSY